MNFINQKTKKQKNFLDNAPKLSSKKLKGITSTDDINQNILAVLTTFSDLKKEIRKNFYTLRRQLTKLQLLSFLAKFLTERKYLMRTLTFARSKHLYVKSSDLYCQTNNDGLKAVFYKHFSNELAFVLLNVYDSWESLSLLGTS